MREENSSEIFHEALNFLEEEIIEETDKLRGGVLADKTTQLSTRGAADEIKAMVQKELRPWRKWVALAASVGLLIIVGGVWNASIGKDTGNSSENYLTRDEETAEEKQQDEVVNMMPEIEAVEDKLSVPESIIGSDNVYKGEGLSELDQEMFAAGLEDFVTAYYLTKEKWDTKSEEEESFKKECKEFPAEKRAILEAFLYEFSNGKRQMIDFVSTWENFERDSEPIYHLFVERQDGTEVHLLLFGDGYACYYGERNVWVTIEDEVYASMIEVMEKNNL